MEREKGRRWRELSGEGRKRRGKGERRGGGEGEGEEVEKGGVRSKKERRWRGGG